MSNFKLKNSEWYRKDNYTVYHTNGGDFIDYSYAEKNLTALPDVNVFFHDSGMVACHNMPCPVCKNNHAVFVTSSGFFDVCHTCRQDGWYVGKRDVTKGKKFWEIWK